MGEVAEAVVFGDFFLRVAEGAGDVDHDDLAAVGADDVVVVFGGIVEFVVAARPLEVDLVDEVQAFQQGHHAENGGVVGGFALGHGEVLDFLEGERFVGLEEHVQDAAPAPGDTHALAAQAVKDGIGSEMEFGHG